MGGPARGLARAPAGLKGPKGPAGALVTTTHPAPPRGVAPGTPPGPTRHPRRVPVRHPRGRFRQRFGRPGPGLRLGRQRHPRRPSDPHGHQGAALLDHFPGRGGAGRALGFRPPRHGHPHHPPPRPPRGPGHPSTPRPGEHAPGPRPPGSHRHRAGLSPFPPRPMAVPRGLPRLRRLGPFAPRPRVPLRPLGPLGPRGEPWRRTWPRPDAQAALEPAQAGNVLGSVVGQASLPPAAASAAPQGGRPQGSRRRWPGNSPAEGAPAPGEGPEPSEPSARLEPPVGRQASASVALGGRPRGRPQSRRAGRAGPDGAHGLLHGGRTGPPGPRGPGDGPHGQPQPQPTGPPRPVPGPPTGRPRPVTAPGEAVHGAPDPGPDPGPAGQGPGQPPDLVQGRPRRVVRHPDGPRLPGVGPTGQNGQEASLGPRQGCGSFGARRVPDDGHPRAPGAGVPRALGAP